MDKPSVLFSKSGVSQLFLVVLFLLWGTSMQAQVTPGLILQPAQSPGNTVLDPDGDGYVSAKTNGVQQGFTIPPNNDVTQSELPFVALVKPDPTGDILRGPSGGFSEIVGVDEAGNNAILTYSDGTNILFRYRLDGYSSNTTTYCILIDTDGKFGFTGDNADPNAVSGNAGFEIEIALTTNFHVRVYNVDGTKNGTVVYSGPIETHHQKSLAITTSSGNPDYFYDFYVPKSALTGITFSAPTTPTTITDSTPMRYVAVTTMNTSPAIGNNAVSDVGGTTSTGSLDAIYQDFIETQTPTPPGEEMLERSQCPTINAIAQVNATITGTTTEAVGTIIKVMVYQSDGTTLIGQGTVTTTGSSWSINVSSLTPAVTLAAGQIVKATATAPEKGESADDCSLRTVQAVVCTPPAAPTGIDFSNAGRITVTFTLATAGTKTITVYNSDGSVWATGTSISTTANSTVTLQNGTVETNNGKVPNGTYYATVTFSTCESEMIAACFGTATSVSPTITTNPVVGTTSISGTGLVGSIIKVFVDGVRVAVLTNLATTSWTATVPALQSCQTVTAVQSKMIADGSSVDNGSCDSPPATKTVSRVALTPSIISAPCVTASNYSISGTSAEADGTTITLYNTNSSGAVIGTTTVSNGSWTVSGLNQPAGTIVVAKVTAGTCLTPSADSSPITITTQTNASNYTLSFNPVSEGATSVSGSLSGGTYPVSVQLYVDEVPTGTPDTIDVAGTWTVSGLIANNLYIGATLKVSLTSASACESALSTSSTIVQCSAPALPTYSGGSKSYCAGGVGELTLSGSTVGVIYQLVNSSGVAQGPSVAGTGNVIVLTTSPLSSNLMNVYVKAYKVLSPSCGIISSTAINFDVQRDAPTVNFTSTTLTVAAGTGIVNLAYSTKSTSPSADRYIINYSVAAKQQGFVDIDTTAIPASPIVLTVPTVPAPVAGTYTGIVTILSNEAGACSSVYSFSITVFGATSPPVISTHPVGSTICTNNTASLSVTAVGTGTLTYQWQSSKSYMGPYTNLSTGTGFASSNYITAVLDSTKHYRVLVTNAYGSAISQVATVSVTGAPAASGVISGSNSVRVGSSYQFYSVAPIEGATSYEWTYSGSGVTINGSGTSIYLNFGMDATSGTLTVRGVNNCGNGSTATLNITVNKYTRVISNRNVTPLLRR